jgi:hypothetical protein
VSRLTCVLGEGEGEQSVAVPDDQEVADGEQAAGSGAKGYESRVAVILTVIAVITAVC